MRRLIGEKALLGKWSSRQVKSVNPTIGLVTMRRLTGEDALLGKWSSRQVKSVNPTINFFQGYT